MNFPMPLLSYTLDYLSVSLLLTIRMILFLMRSFILSVVGCVHCRVSAIVTGLEQRCGNSREGKTFVPLTLMDMMNIVVKKVTNGRYNSKTMQRNCNIIIITTPKNIKSQRTASDGLCHTTHTDTHTMQSMVCWPFFHSDVTHYDAPPNGKGHSNYTNQMSNAHRAAFNTSRTVQQFFHQTPSFPHSVPLCFYITVFIHVWMPIWMTWNIVIHLLTATIFIFHKFCNLHLFHNTEYIYMAAFGADTCGYFDKTIFSNKLLLRSSVHFGAMTFYS